MKIFLRILPICLWVALLPANLSAAPPIRLDFEHSYRDVFSPAADSYIVERVNVKKIDAKDLTWWQPDIAGQDARLTMRYDFPEPVQAAYLRVNANDGLSVWNYGNGIYGSGSVWASKDNVAWVKLLDAPTPIGLDAFYSYDGFLPEFVLGAQALWLQVRMRSEGANDKVQYLRHSTNNVNDCFDLKIQYPTNAPPLIQRFQLAMPKALELRVFGSNGPVRIEYATNLNESILPNRWWNLAALQITNSPMIYVDTSASNSPKRFYRAVRGVLNPPPTANPATGVTSSGFTANWSSVSGATGYWLDVSTNSSFSSYVSGYQNLDAGNVTSRSVNSLSASTTYYYRVRAYNTSGTDGNSVTIIATTDPNPASDMVLIPAGTFAMGDTFNEGDGDELPTHVVSVSAFSMDKYEVTKGLWDEVLTWAVAHGYSFNNAGLGKAANHPVHSVTWWDVVKWCNARSEKEGRVPAYYTDAAQTTVYRTGQVNVESGWVKWNAGYRLPTEAEWEKAARGGASGHRFPWSDVDTVTHSQANYFSTNSYSYDISSTRGYQPSYDNDPKPYTSPVGSFTPNGYGLHDMAGNVWEWCWDWSGLYSSGSQTDPRGQTSRSQRVMRGGCWYNGAFNCRVADRFSYSPDIAGDGIGFRAVLAPEVLNPPPPTANPASDVTSNGFTANWSSVIGATGYWLDASTNSSFSSYLSGYQNLDLGNVTSRSVSGLSAGTTYYYRVRAYNTGTTSGNSGTISVTTNPDTIAPAGMALIPAGSFTMGTLVGGGADEHPAHTVYVSAFYMDKYEVTKALWDEVKTWATAHGYSFLQESPGKAANHPVYNVAWHDAVKWCNARSEKEGRVPAYYTIPAQTRVYRTGQVDVENSWVKWNSGYRLPTEAEWEKAARGGASGHRFPWSDVDTITHNQANYFSTASDARNISPTLGFHPSYDNDPMPYTSPVGSFAPNGYGLHDMAGNVWEWCWDWYGPYQSAQQSNPKGPDLTNPDLSLFRVFRGGSWFNSSLRCPVAYRYEHSPDGLNGSYGFRTVLQPGQP